LLPLPEIKTAIYKYKYVISIYILLYISLRKQDNVKFLKKYNKYTPYDKIKITLKLDYHKDGAP